MNVLHRRALVALLLTAAVVPSYSGAAQRGDTPPRGSLRVDINRPGVTISPMLYGLMTEEINHAYDGGLYADLIQNRALEDNESQPVHWFLIEKNGGAGSLALDRSQPVPGTALTRSLRLEMTQGGPQALVGAANDGFWGVPIRPGARYRASLWARTDRKDGGTVRLAITRADGTEVAAADVRAGFDWSKVSAELTVPRGTRAEADGRFLVAAGAPGVTWLTQVSLFPPTYHNRPGGLRTDLMRLLVGLRPTFLRLPGGNYLDPGHYEWKKTIGPIDQRAGHPGAWEYRSSDGLGLLEFFRWCEDLKIEPVLCVTDGRGWLPSNGDVAPLVQDALDEIEYATGGPETAWGARRIQDGHPAPVRLRYVEIGNEDFFDPLPVYNARFAKFYDSIRARYPALQIISTRSDVTSRRPDVIDDHFYRSADDMAADSHHYDGYSRSGPKIFVGEWASIEGRPTPTMQAALGDAAWLTGLERNSDLVVMEAYAPLLVNVNPGASQWPTNLIGYDSLHSFGSPAYYVQQMFGQNRGTWVLPTTVSAAVTRPTVRKGRIGVGTWETQAEFKDIRVTGENGKTLFTDSFAGGSSGFETSTGNWSVQDGVLRQSSLATRVRAEAGDREWTNYALTMKARKIGGREGFLLIFHAAGEADYLWWNVGGWGNTRSAIQRIRGGDGELGTPSTFTVETGRWYDLRVEVQGTEIRCYVDGRLVNSGNDRGTAPFYATASRDADSGDVIIKAVNTSGDLQPMRIDLPGLSDGGYAAAITELSGPPAGMNSVNEPRKIAPRKRRLNSVQVPFDYTFPRHSVTVMRIRSR